MFKTIFSFSFYIPNKSEFYILNDNSHYLKIEDLIFNENSNSTHNFLFNENYS